MCRNPEHLLLVDLNIFFFSKQKSVTLGKIQPFLDPKADKPGTLPRRLKYIWIQMANKRVLFSNRKFVPNSNKNKNATRKDL